MLAAVFRFRCFTWRCVRWYIYQWTLIKRNRINQWGNRQLFMPSVHDRTKRFIYRSEFWSLKLKQPTAWPRCHTYNVCEEFNIEFPRERPGRKMLKHTHTRTEENPRNGRPTGGRRGQKSIHSEVSHLHIAGRPVANNRGHANPPARDAWNRPPPPPGFIFVVLRFIVSLGCKCD